MTSSFKIAVKNLDAEFVQAMKEKYAEAELEITINRSPTSPLLEEKDFWAIIDHLDWEQEEDEAILESAINKLASLPIAQIYSFEEILSEKLYRLDQQRFAINIGDSSYDKDRYFSADVFLYARACVIANGEEAYELVLYDPTKMPKNITFEPLLHLAARAYEYKTKKPFSYILTYNYETYSNSEGWKEMTYGLTLNQ